MDQKFNVWKIRAIVLTIATMYGNGINNYKIYTNINGNYEFMYLGRMFIELQKNRWRKFNSCK